MHSRIIGAAAAILALLVVPEPIVADEIPAAALPADRLAALDASIETIRHRFRVPGLAVGIVEDGRVVYARGFGVRDTQAGATVTPHTLFHVASISKTFTAMAVMQLAAQGRLDLDAPVGRYLPDFANSPITLTQLLTHSAGLADWFPATGAADDRAVANYVAKVARHEPAYAPGKGWEYSDTAFNVLGAVIETVSAETYSQYMRRHVLDAAEMSESTFEPPDASGEIAWPNVGEIFVRRASSYPWDRAFLPSAGLNASVADLMKWALVHLRRDPALLAPSAYEELFRHRLDSAWEGIGMGLGWQLERRGYRWLPRHAGAEHGFTALLTLYPDQQRAIVILSNGETTPRWAIRDVVEAVLDSEPVVLPEVPVLQRRSTQLIAVVMGIALIVLAATLLRRRRERTKL